MIRHNFLNKRAIIAVVFLLAAGVFFYWDTISDIYRFDRKQSDEISEFSQNTFFPVPSAEQPAVQKDNPPVPTTIIKKESLPKYVGRDPEEINPTKDEVALYNEEQRNNLYASIKNLGQAVKKDQGYFFGWMQLGLIKKVIGDFAGARDAWEYAGLISPANTTSFANLGEIYWRYLPDFPRSEKNFRISLKNKPNEFSTYDSLSQLYFFSYKEKKNLAYDVLLEGMTTNPHDPNFPRALASLYERDGNWTKALEWWQKVLVAEPNNIDVAAAIASLKKKIPSSP